MIKFLVWHVLIFTASCELYKEESGWYLHEYAPKYDNYQPKDYHFSYAVNDYHTGDHKSHWEIKEKGVVRGGYSLLDPDGTTRLVEYIADDHGFRAVVKKIGTPIHQEPRLVPLVPEFADFKSYNGHIENYANAHVEPILYNIEQTIEHVEVPKIEVPELPKIEIPELTKIQVPEIPSAHEHVIEEVRPHPPEIIQPIRYEKIEHWPIPKHVPVLQEKFEEVPPLPILRKIEIPVQHVYRNYVEHHIPPQPIPVPHHVPEQVVPKLIPIGPSYRTTVEYHGLTGNPQDDSRYKNQDAYYASFSEKIPKVVPPPQKEENVEKKEFLIYFPDKESQ